MSLSTSVDEEKAATLFYCKAPKMLCGVSNLILDLEEVLFLEDQKRLDHFCVLQVLTTA